MLKGDPSIGGFEPTVSVFENVFPLYAEKTDQTTSLKDHLIKDIFKKCNISATSHDIYNICHLTKIYYYSDVV